MTPGRNRRQAMIKLSWSKYSIGCFRVWDKIVWTNDYFHHAGIVVCFLVRWILSLFLLIKLFMGSALQRVSRQTLKTAPK